MHIIHIVDRKVKPGPELMKLIYGMYIEEKEWKHSLNCC